MANPTDTQIDTAVPVDGEPSRTLVNAALKSMTGESEAHGTKLAGIQEGATANSTDLVLLDRANHTGTQAAATISDLPDLLSAKVDAEPGKVLSDTSFTQAEKYKLSQLEDGHFKGVHIGLTALQTAHPTGVAGDYASVDEGVSGVNWYAWSEVNTAWEIRTGESTEVTPAQVKTYYEQNADTNAFTDAEKSQLAALDGRFAWNRQGTWNAATNTPELLNGTGNQGDYYVVTKPGTRSFGGLTYTFQEYDWVMFSGGVWQRLATNHITSWTDIQNKPVVIAAGGTQAAARTAIDALGTPDKGAPSGVAPLNAGGQVPVEHIPDLSAIYAPKHRGPLSPPVFAMSTGVSAETPIPDSTTQAVTWSAPALDPFSMHNGTTGFVVPSWATYARVTLRLTVSFHATGHRWAGVRRNGTVVHADRRNANPTTWTNLNLHSIAFAVSSGDVIDLAVYQNSGVSLNLADNMRLQIELYANN